jgi:hypothetical protein
MAIFPGTSITPVAGGVYTYPIDQSLRFEDGSSAHLSRTPSVAGNRKTWTFSTWFKGGDFYTSLATIFGGTQGSQGVHIGVNFHDLRVFYYSSSYEFNFTPSMKIRDPSAWYHLVVAVDTTQATSSDRVKIYINGTRITDFSVETYPAQNLDTSVNNTTEQKIGEYPGQAGNYWNGYLAEVHLIDGQALGPEYFGETDDTWGIWKPKAYSGSYGTNGFYLDFSNGAAIGEDSSGNSNDWTASNLAATDIMLDSPTNNFATLNPLDRFTNTASGTYKEGNLRLERNSPWCCSASSLRIPNDGGKYYFESYAQYIFGGNEFVIGVSDSKNAGAALQSASDGGIVYNSSGYKLIDGTQTSYGATFATGDIIGVAVDTSAATVTFYKNNSSQGSISFTGSSLENATDFSPAISLYRATAILNFGQDSSFAGNKTAQNNTDDNGYGDFYYSPPSGFLALCSANLPEAAVIPSENFDVVLDAGADIKTTAEALFTDQLEWIKDRANANNHQLIDSVRGTSAVIQSNTTAAETTYSTPSGNSVAWVWKANGTGSSNTDGSITSTVAANVDAGFSIVSYTGNGTNGATVGHGLSQAPEIVLTKNRSIDGQWNVTAPTIMGNGYWLALNSTAVKAFYDSTWTTNSTQLVLSNGGGHNGSGNAHIAYCFHSVDGYSKFGSFTGNGSTDGTFVYTGFRPAYILYKATNIANAWLLYDTARSAYNVVHNVFYPYTSGAELDSADYNIDILSNGFKLRTSYSYFNGSGNTYIYMAFAESPFKYSTAR